MPRLASNTGISVGFIAPLPTRAIIDPYTSLRARILGASPPLRSGNLREPIFVSTLVDLSVIQSPYQRPSVSSSSSGATLTE